MRYAEMAYQRHRARGWKPEKARSVLPTSTKTELVWTANAREWRHILKLRMSKAAHPQMREVMDIAGALLVERAPVLFEKIVAEAKAVTP